jgi:MFS family permease
LLLQLHPLRVAELEDMGEVSQLRIDPAIFPRYLWPVRKVPLHAGFSAQELILSNSISAATPTWPAMMKELGFTIETLNNGYATGSAALAVGAILFIPFALKYGRRPMYLFSLIGQIAVMIWSAKMQNTADLILTNLFNCLLGALAEVIVQMTVAGKYPLTALLCIN